MLRYIGLSVLLIAFLAGGALIFVKKNASKVLLSKQFWEIADTEKLNFVLKHTKNDLDLNEFIDEKGRTIAYYAVIYGNCPKCIPLLHERKVDFSKLFQFSPGKFTLLHIMFFPDNVPKIEIIKALIQTGMDINILSGRGSPPLFSAIFFNRNLEIIKQMVELGATINFRHAEYGVTPLILALETDMQEREINTQTIEFLLKKK